MTLQAELAEIGKLGVDVGEFTNALNLFDDYPEFKNDIERELAKSEWNC